MDEHLSQRTKYLALFLLSLRQDTTRVNGHAADIKFSIDEIQVPDIFSARDSEKKDQIWDALTEIEGDELNDLGQSSYTAIGSKGREDDGKTIILKKATTPKLLEYIQKRIQKGTSLFGLAKNTRDQQVLTFLEEKTRIQMKGKSFRIFSYLLKHHGEEVTYVKLFDNEVKSNSWRSDYIAQRFGTKEARLDYIGNGITELRKKLNKGLQSKCPNIKLEIIKNKKHKDSSSEAGIYILKL